MPMLSRTPTVLDHYDDHYGALIERQQNTNKSKDTYKCSGFLSIGSTVAVHHDVGGH